MVEACEAVRAPGEHVVVDGIVELLCVVEDGDEGVPNELFSGAVVGGECGGETVNKGCPVDEGCVVVAGGGVSDVRISNGGRTRRGGGASRRRGRLAWWTGVIIETPTVVIPRVLR